MAHKRHVLRSALPLVLVLPAIFAALGSANRPPVIVPAREKAFKVDRVNLGFGDNLILYLYNNTGSQIYDSKRELAVEWNAPIWRAEFNGTLYDTRLYSPAVIIGSSTFRLTIVNELPFQRPCSCGCTVAGDANYCAPCVEATSPLSNGTFPVDNPLGIYNGPHNLVHTNMHTHGLKVDVGANDINNLDVCANQYTLEEVCSVDNSFDSSRINCQIFADNIYPTVFPGGMVATNTYILPPTIPGTAWYHPHLHGSVAYLTPTTNGLLITPDINPCQLFTHVHAPFYKDMDGVMTWRDWPEAISKHPDCDTWSQHKSWDKCSKEWKNGREWDDFNWHLWEKKGLDYHKAKECRRFINLMARFPNFAEDSEIIHIAGLWFRETLSGDVSDDTSAFIACNALPPSPLIAPDGLNADGSCNLINYDNREGRDFVALNNVIQPTFHLKAGRYKRWNILNSFTMKWLDITIHKFDPESTATFTKPAKQCKMWLLAHDGVYIEHIPRFVETFNTSDPNTQGEKVNNLMLGPGNRADIFIKCDEPGTYALVSGAGPYNTNPGCAATHCELVGGRCPITDVVVEQGNRFWRDRLLSAALLAVLEVKETDKPPEPDLVPEACRTRYELYEYLDYKEFAPPGATNNQGQCWNLVNMMDGGACNVNGVVFGNTSEQGIGLACMNQGYSQDWDYRGTDYHPFHLHETPVRTKAVPQCLTTETSSTNFWKTGDWWDSVFIPPCQCAVEGCESMPMQFLATSFPNVPADYGTQDTATLRTVAQSYLRDYVLLQMRGAPNTPNPFTCPNRKLLQDPNWDLERHNYNKCPAVPACNDRFSVLHCHHLSHEDEGCMAVVYWNCLIKPNDPNFEFCTGVGRCPNLSAAQLAMMGRMSHKEYQDMLKQGKTLI